MKTLSEQDLRAYIQERIESLKNENLYRIGYYMRDEICSRLTELKWFAQRFGIDVGPTHNFEPPKFSK